MGADYIEQIENIGEEAQTSSEKSTARPDKEQFDKAFDKANLQATSEQKTIEPPSLDNLARSNGTKHDSRHLTAEEIADQTKHTTERIDEVKKDLESTKVIESAYQPLLRNKLSHIDESLQIAVSKAGLETGVASTELNSQTLINPIERFLGGLSHAQNQLHDLGSFFGIYG